MGRHPSLFAHFARNIADYGKIAQMRRDEGIASYHLAARKEAVISKLWLVPLSRRLANRIAHERRWPEPREAVEYSRRMADRKAYERRWPEPREA